MPVSNSSVLVDRSESGGASRWIDQRSSALTGPRPSIGSPIRLNTRPSVALPDGHRHRGAGIDAFLAADHAVGAAQGDAADAAAAQVLLHFAGEVDLDPLVLAVDLDGVVDRRQMGFGEFDVERRADHLGYVANAFRGGLMVGRGCHGFCRGLVGAERG